MHSSEFSDDSEYTNPAQRMVTATSTTVDTRRKARSVACSTAGRLDQSWRDSLGELHQLSYRHDHTDIEVCRCRTLAQVRMNSEVRSR